MKDVLKLDPNRSAVSLLFLLFLLFGSTTAGAGEFNCDDPASLPPGTTDVAVTIDADLSEIKPGETITYTVQIHNCGPEIATDLEITQDLPTDVRFDGVNQISGPAYTTIEVPQTQILLESASWSVSFTEMAVDATAVFEVTVTLGYI